MGILLPSKAQGLPKSQILHRLLTAVWLGNPRWAYCWPKSKQSRPFSVCILSLRAMTQLQSGTGDISQLRGTSSQLGPADGSQLLECSCMALGAHLAQGWVWSKVVLYLFSLYREVLAFPCFSSQWWKYRFKRFPAFSPCSEAKYVKSWMYSAYEA